MRTMLHYIKNYISSEYGIEFKLEMIEPTNYEKYEELIYRVGKKEYRLSVDWAYQYKDKERTYAWSIYADYMDYKEWYGFGGAYIDEGHKTIDEIMTNQWGVKKNSKQISLF